MRSRVWTAASYGLILLWTWREVYCEASALNDREANEQHRHLDVSAASAAAKYTSFQCIGGSQVFKTESMFQTSVKVFPLNNPEFRTCHYRNMCLVNGTLTYYQKYLRDAVPKEYLPIGFDNGKIHHLSYLRGFTMPIATEYGAIPPTATFHNIPYIFLDSNSWSFNYGHYINDNVIPTFVASRLFNFRFEDSQQLFETSCTRFSTLEPAFANKIVTYNRSMGTYKNACLHRINSLYKHFYDHPPMFVDDPVNAQRTICFKNMISGQGSTFGLKSIDLSRGLLFREFRDFVLSRIKRPQPKQENRILVGLRTVGSAGGAILNDLCGNVKKAFQRLPEAMTSKFHVSCFVPSDLSFEDEIAEVQRAKVLISVHGTITYMALFSRDGTQQISLASPKELKENQMLLYATHFNTLYLTWDKMDQQLSGVLLHALTLSEAFHNNS